MMEFTVRAHRVDAHGSTASCKDASITLDTDLGGRSDAFNPAELLLGALGACMIKGIERVMPILQMDIRGVDITLRAKRQDTPPKLIDIEYEIVVTSDEPEHRLDLLHQNVQKYGTVFNTVAGGTDIRGTLRAAE
ncbi:MAG: osmotically inducible protein C [Phycisphaerae bacterium]|nr:osmotically inducible protein C [Phycisphaerae bacterium]|tara:strand:+ start:107 stop:511 length:405 start_codon:yes stop_codon:yes gene_type:complete